VTFPAGKERHWREELDRRPWLRRLVRNWERGGRVSDQEYLRLGHKALQEDDELCGHILAQALHVWIARYLTDAAQYYGVSARGARMRKAWKIATVGALRVCTENLVKLDADTPVPSHFERVFFEAFKYFLFDSLKIRQRQLPDGEGEFVSAFEEEWRKVLMCGNGYHGLTIVPRVSIVDAVRYQQLQPRDKIISRSVVQYYVLVANVFPTIAQLLLPAFRQKAIAERIVEMFEPLVVRCAAQARTRLADTDRKPLGILQEEFRAVARQAVDEYAFMHGKTGNWRDAVGMIGVSAGEGARWRIDIAAVLLGHRPISQEIVHVNASAFIAARLHQHLREYYPAPWARHQQQLSLHAQGGEDRLSVQDFLDTDESEATHFDLDLSASGRAVAARKNGVEYLFVNEMAAECGVTADQLRSWDRAGELPAIRLEQVSPAHRGRVSAQWRVYPNTPQMCEQIRTMAQKKARARRGLEEGEYSRKEAARALGVHKDTLRRWERRGIAKPQWRNQRPIYTAAEIRRLKHLVEEGGISPHPGRAQQKKQRGAGRRKGQRRNRRRQ